MLLGKLLASGILAVYPSKSVDADALRSLVTKIVLLVDLSCDTQPISLRYMLVYPVRRRRPKPRTFERGEQTADPGLATPIVGYVPRVTDNLKTRERQVLFPHKPPN